MIIKDAPSTDQNYLCIRSPGNGILWINRVEISISALLVPVRRMRPRGTNFPSWSTRAAWQSGATPSYDNHHQISQAFIWAAQEGSSSNPIVTNWIDE